jgi:hypothetical protein
MLKTQETIVKLKRKELELIHFYFFIHLFF